MTAPLATPLVLPSQFTNKVADSGGTNVNAAKLSAIIEESERLQRWCNRRFDEYIDTKYYDVRSVNAGGPVEGMELYLGSDLRSLTTLTNGDGAAITTGYTLMPRHADSYGVAVKRSIRLSAIGSVFWSAGSNDWREAISVLGLWGYGGQWKDTGLTVASGLAASSGATTFTASGSGLEAGMVVRWDSEYGYLGAVSGTAASSIDRGYNNSTAVVHVNGTAIYRWEAAPLVQRLVQRLVMVSAAQDSSPLFGQIVIGDATAAVTTDGSPQDVLKDAARLRPAFMPMGV